MIWGKRMCCNNGNSWKGREAGEDHEICWIRFIDSAQNGRPSVSDLLTVHKI